MQRTKITYCDQAKAGGCSGTLTLAPIGGAHRRVVVTLPGPAGGAALAIEAAESERC